jgi:hypothetical protein
VIGELYSVFRPISEVCPSDRISKGLRAILLNHNLARGFSGGFIGVDVFFVISGFLITSIIVDQIGRNQFTFAEFYRGRIVRLLRALLFSLIVVTIVSAFVMMPSELASCGQSLAYSSIFCANSFFYLDAGYFTASAATRPLIHLWSGRRRYLLAHPAGRSHPLEEPQAASASTVLMASPAWCAR